MAYIKQITRRELVDFISNQMVQDKPNGSRHHYGYQELRQLLDKLYGGPPSSPDEELTNQQPLTKY